MHILHVSRNYIYPLGGMEEFIYQITNRQKIGKVNVEVVTTAYRSGMNTYREDIFGVVPVKSYPVSLFLFGYCYSKGLNEYLSKTDFDVIHAHGWGTDAIDASMKWGEKRCRTVFVTPYALFHTEQLKLMKMLYNKFRGRDVLRKAVIIALTSSQAKYFKNIGAKNVIVVPGGVDQGRLMQPAFSYKEKLGISGNVILCIGRLARYKGFHTVLQALKKVHEKFPETYLLIAGEDWGAEEELKTLARKLGIGRYVIFLGSLYPNSDELISAYHDADIYVSSSKIEGFGLTIIEAMACGKPVISTRTGVTVDLKDTLLTYDYENHNQLVKLICDVLKNEEFARDTGEKGKKIVQNHFTWDKVSEKLLKLYHSYE